MVSWVLNKVSRILSSAGVIVTLLVSIMLLFHTVWLTAEVSQERSVSPTAMRLSLNDIVTLVRGHAVHLLQHSTNVQNLCLM